MVGLVLRAGFGLAWASGLLRFCISDTQYLRRSCRERDLYSNHRLQNTKHQSQNTEYKIQNVVLRRYSPWKYPLSDSPWRFYEFVTCFLIGYLRDTHMMPEGRINIFPMCKSWYLSNARQTWNISVSSKPPYE